MAQRTRQHRKERKTTAERIQTNKNTTPTVPHLTNKKIRLADDRQVKEKKHTLVFFLEDEKERNMWGTSTSARRRRASPLLTPKEAPRTDATATACCVGKASALDVLHALSVMKEVAAAKHEALGTWIEAARRVDDRIVEIVGAGDAVLAKALALDTQTTVDAAAVVSARDLWYKRISNTWYDTSHSISEIDHTLDTLDRLASVAVEILDTDLLRALEREATAWREAQRMARVTAVADRLVQCFEGIVEPLGGVVPASEAIRDAWGIMQSGNYMHVLTTMAGSPNRSAAFLVFARIIDVIDPRVDLVGSMDQAVERFCLPAEHAAIDSATD